MGEIPEWLNTVVDGALTGVDRTLGQSFRRFPTGLLPCVVRCSASGGLAGALAADDAAGRGSEDLASSTGTFRVSASSCS